MAIRPSWEMSEITFTATTLEGIRDAVAQIAKRIDAPESLLPTYGPSMDAARPHIDVDARGLHYVVAQRGEEFARRTTNDPKELAYWVFHDVTFEMAADFEAGNRKEMQDSRRLIFQKQLDFLKELDESWVDTTKRQQQAVLEHHPFDDYASVRAALTDRLTGEGYSHEEAWETACEKYPLPK